MTLPCPRRIESGVNFSSPETDHWDEEEACSYCGSLKPEALFKAIEQGCELTPTDKNYKLYIDLPNPHFGKQGCFTSSTHPFEGSFVLTEEIADTVAWKRPQDREYYLGKNVKLSLHSKTNTGKFYFQHFSIEEQVKFIKLYNDKKLKLNFPGHFYRLPFFMGLGKAEG